MHKTRLKIAIAALLTAALGGPASAEFITAGRMVSLCDATHRGESNENATFYVACLSYLTAVKDASLTLAERGDMPARICPPPTTESEALRHTFLQQVKDRPDDWELSASEHALDAFREAWPCN